ncbi:hypothetical protein [Shewanella algae]|uniref:hypothetical protein n=1 Tax=Shewanella algae TaxID=38313 RepID=UPI003005E0B1
MSQCQLKIGFFTLSPCGQPAVGSCSECQASVCEHHLDPKTGLCFQCAAKPLKVGKEVYENPRSGTKYEQLSLQGVKPEDPLAGFALKQLYLGSAWYQLHTKHGSYNKEFDAEDFAAFELPVDEDDEQLPDYEYRDIYDS